jgi:hypothetical protein
VSFDVRWRLKCVLHTACLLFSDMSNQRQSTSLWRAWRIRAWTSPHTDVERDLSPYSHAERYLETFLPSCGHEFFETTRYLRRQKTQRRSKAAKVDLGIRATRQYRVDDLVESLKGRTVDLTDDEDDALREDVNGADFSCIANLGKNCFQLLLGPARFVNVRVLIVSSLSPRLYNFRSALKRLRVEARL